MKKLLLASFVFAALLLIPKESKAAIAFSTATASSANPVTSLTFSHTCASTATALFIGITANTSLDSITGVTYAGLDVTRSTMVLSGTERTFYLYYTSNCVVGANNVVISAGASIFIGAAAGSYTGTALTGQPETLATGRSASGTSITVSTTVLNDQAWVVGMGKFRQGSVAGSANTILRASDKFGGSSGITGWFDMNTATGVGTRSLTVTGASGENGAIVVTISTVEASGGGGASSFVVSPTAIPKGHARAIVTSSTGTSTTWAQGVTTFTASNVTGTSVSTWTIRSSTQAYISLQTGSGTGILSLSDVVGSTNTQIFVGTPTFNISPTSGVSNSSYTLTITGSSNVWTQETLSTLFSASGGYLSNFSGVSVTDDNSATATLWTGTATASITIAENVSTMTAVFTVAGSMIGVTSPAQYQLFQRDWNRNNQADIYVSGTYTGTPTSIEANWNSGNYEVILSTPSGGTYQGKILRQNTGCGTVNIRFTNDTSISTSVANVCIGDVYVIAGESHPSGRLTNNQSFTGTTGTGLMFGNDYLWKVLADPTDSSTGQIDTVSSDSATGSVWPLLGSSITIRENVPVTFIPCAKGGTTISQWLPSSNHYDRTTLYGSMVNRSTSSGSFGVRAVLMWIGNNDVVALTSSATFISNMVNFSTSVKKDMGCPVVLSTLNTSSNETDADEAVILNALYQLWERGQNIARGPDISDLADDDGVHMTSNAKGGITAARWYNALKTFFYTSPTFGYGSAQ